MAASYLQEGLGGLAGAFGGAGRNMRSPQEKIGTVEERKFWLDIMRRGGQTYGWDPDAKEYYEKKDRSQYDHGAVPENIKQSMLSGMLDHYGNVNMQHMLVPEE